MATRNGTGVRRATKHSKRRLVIDFLYIDKDGYRQRCRKVASVQTMAAACAESAKMQELAAATGNPLAEVRTSITFGEFVDGDWKTLFLPRFRPATRRRYLELLGQGMREYFQGMRLDAINNQCVRAYSAKLVARKVGARSHVSLVSSILRAAVELGALAKMPDLPPLPRPGRKLPDCPSPEEVTALIEHSTGWLRTAIALAAFAGLRSGEVRALEVRDVDLKANILHVRHALSDDQRLTPKSGHERIVPISPELVTVLTQAVSRKLPAARIVLNQEGRTPPRTDVLYQLTRLCKRHGLQQRSFHSLRHAFCSSLLRRGASVEAVRIVAGHSDLKTTARYLHANVSEVRNIMDWHPSGTGTESDSISSLKSGEFR